MTPNRGVLGRAAMPRPHSSMLTRLTPSMSRGRAALRGLLATVLGIVFVVWPDITVGTLVILFALYCLGDAFMQFTTVLGAGASRGRRIPRVLLGLLDVAAAAVAVAWPGPTAEVLVLVIGVWDRRR